MEFLKFKRKILKPLFKFGYIIYSLGGLLKILMPRLHPTSIKSGFLIDFKAPRVILRIGVE